MMGMILRKTKKRKMIFLTRIHRIRILKQENAEVRAIQSRFISGKSALYRC